jgi:hypothetical protein
VFASLEAKRHILKITAAGRAGKLFCTALTMERLFSPCTRLHDILESQGRLLEAVRRHDHELLQELNLNVSTEELLSAERKFIFADLYALVRNRKTVAWLTPHGVLVRNSGKAMCYWEQLDESCYFRCSADGKDIVVLAHSHEHLLEICDVLLRLLAVRLISTNKQFEYS